MPTYEYACKSCGNQWEEIQRISEPALDTCPKCNAATAQRLVSQGNFILKGGGWYTTGGYGTSGTTRSETHSSSTSGGSTAATASTGTASSGASASSAPASGGDSKASSSG